MFVKAFKNSEPIHLTGAVLRIHDKDNKINSLSYVYSILCFPFCPLDISSIFDNSKCFYVIVR